MASLVDFFAVGFAVAGFEVVGAAFFEALPLFGLRGSARAVEVRFLVALGMVTARL